jgi:hypothetical protein
MRRKWAIFSPLSIILTLVLFSGLGATVWRSGGQSFSPGALSAKGYTAVTLAGYASHADFEGQCSLCHQPLKSVQAELCVDCHSGVAQQIVAEVGVHGNTTSVMACADCHSDHHGNDFDPLWGALWVFDHASADFSLQHHLVDDGGNPIACTACHIEEQGFKVDLSGCVVCHADSQVAFMTQHILDFGESCLECHDGIDRMVGFDHSGTEFPLEGGHAEARCANCHMEGRFKETALECQGCHQEPPVHRGVFGLDCENCHRSFGWLPSLIDGQMFEHASQAGFSLVLHTQDVAGNPLNCLACHPDGIQHLEVDTCIACHAGQDPSFMEQHIALFDPDCLDCHDGVDRLSDFDHFKVFPLEGGHAVIPCESCHLVSEKGRVFKGTPLECYQCHAEPQIHAGFFGLQCQFCHITSAWTPAQLTQHAFPLDHGEQGILECQVCHTDTYTVYTCYGCHDHQPDQITSTHLVQGIALEKISECTQCHPNGELDQESG